MYENLSLEEKIGALCNDEIDYIHDAFPLHIPKDDVIMRINHLKDVIMRINHLKDELLKQREPSPVDKKKRNVYLRIEFCFRPTDSESWDNLEQHIDLSLLDFQVASRAYKDGKKIVTMFTETFELNDDINKYIKNLDSSLYGIVCQSESFEYELMLLLP
jgi:hypothetical protein